MTITSNNVSAINAALLSFRNNIQTLKASSVKASTTNNSSSEDEEIDIELLEFVEAQGLNTWGYIKYKSLGMCYGEFTNTASTRIGWNTPTLTYWKCYTDRSFPFSFKKVPTVFYYFDSTTSTAGYLADPRLKQPIVPTTNSFRICPLVELQANSANNLSATVRYHIIALGEI